MNTLTASPIERFAYRLLALPFWGKVGLVAALAALPYGLAVAQMPGSTWLVLGEWRGILFPLIMLVYIVAVVPWMQQTRQDVVEALRPLAFDPAGFDAAVTRINTGHTSSEWLAFGAGAAGGVGLVASHTTWGIWVDVYVNALYVIMYAATVWALYATAARGRRTGELQHYIAHDNPFDQTPFEAAGRQGLVSALIFAGGTTLSVFFVYTQTGFFIWQNIIIYAILVSATVTIFFVVMWPAHRTLAQAKFQQIAVVRQALYAALRRLHTPPSTAQPAPGLAQEVQAWLALEQRLLEAPTWPYNTQMLRTLGLSVLTPLFVALWRTIGPQLLQVISQ